MAEPPVKVKRYAQGKILQGDQAAARFLCGMDGRWKKHLIGGVINTAWEIAVPYDPTIPRLMLPIEESIPTGPACFEAAIGFYRAVDRVLVHCAAGQNRSMAVTAALLVVTQGMSLEQAMKITNPDLPMELRDSLERWASIRED